MDEDAAERLLADLTAARAAARAAAGRPPLGLRAVEPAPERRAYLCAFEGPAFLCLTGALAVETEEPRARETAVTSLLVEHAEDLIDADALRELARAAGRLLALGAEGDLADPLGAVAEAALDLSAWRDAPERVLASLPEVEAATRRHDALRAAYTRFVTASDPLVAVQDRLAPDEVAALRAVEEAAGRAGLGEAITPRLGAAVAACDKGASEILAAHLGRLTPA